MDAVRGHKSPLTGAPVYVVGAGAVYDGRSLAANLMWGAQAVWVGTRFVASVEAGAPKAHKDTILKAGYEDAVRTLIFTGRPPSSIQDPICGTLVSFLYIYKHPFSWAHQFDRENNRQDEIKDLTSRGIIPHEHELQKHPEKSIQGRSWLIGRVAAQIHDVLPAKAIVDSMVQDASNQLQLVVSNIARSSTSAKL